MCRDDTIHIGLVWFEYKDIESSTLLMTAKSTEDRWDGDDEGNEWLCGFAIHYVLDEKLRPSGSFALFTDDGDGNGDHIGDYATLEEAQRAANEYDINPPPFKLTSDIDEFTG